jgi:hypothetical protein
MSDDCPFEGVLVAVTCGDPDAKPETPAFAVTVATVTNLPFGGQR